MKYFRYVMVFCVIAIFMSTSSGAIAAAPTLAADPSDEVMVDENQNDVLDLDSLSQTSQIAYVTAFNHDLLLTYMPTHLHSGEELVQFFQSVDLPAKQVKTTLKELKPGDIVHIKDTKTPFLIYKEVKEDKVILED